MKFEPKGPVKILQRQKDASTMTPGQTPKRPRDGKVNQVTGQLDMKGPKMERQLGTGYNPEDKQYPQGNGYGKRYDAEKEKGSGKVY